MWQGHKNKQWRTALFGLIHHVDDVRWTQVDMGGKGPSNYITLHAEVIYMSPFINAEIKFISLRSKCQALLSKP